MDEEWVEDQMQLADLVAQLKKARTEAGLSQTQVGETMNCSQGNIGHFERMEFDSRMTTFQRYARAVGQRIKFVVEPLDQPE